MKKAIWILFVTLTLIWTGFAFLAAGLARWTSDAIASDRLAKTTQYVALTSERVTQKLTDATGRVTGQVTAKVAQAVGGEAAGEQQPMDGSTVAAISPTVPAASTPVLPPLPEWVDQWLAPEMVQSIKEWGVWAKSAANAGKVAVADVANASARAVPEAARQAAVRSTNMGGDAAAEATNAAEAAKPADPQSVETTNATDVSDTQWLADIVGWLVPIVWVIWGIGLILGLLLTLIAQWGVSRFVGSSPLKPTFAH
jgi:hypothetical protein